MTMRLKTSVEPIWFDIMPCASFYSNLRSIPEVSRTFQRNQEYTSIFYENNILRITMYGLMVKSSTHVA